MLWQVASKKHPVRWPPTDPTEPSLALDVPEPRLWIFLPLRVHARWVPEVPAPRVGCAAAGRKGVSD